MELGTLTLSYECILPKEACETLCFCKTTLKVFVRKKTKNLIVGFRILHGAQSPSCFLVSWETNSF